MVLLTHGIMHNIDHHVPKDFETSLFRMIIRRQKTASLNVPTVH